MHRHFHYGLLIDLEFCVLIMMHFVKYQHYYRILLFEYGTNNLYDSVLHPYPVFTTIYHKKTYIIYGFIVFMQHYPGWCFRQSILSKGNKVVPCWIPMTCDGHCRSTGGPSCIIHFVIILILMNMHWFKAILAIHKPHISLEQRLGDIPQF